MPTLNLYLAAARSLLSMSVKSVAAALRVSDKKITQIEHDADPDDPKVVQLIQLYEDLGLTFDYSPDNIINGVHISPSMNRVTFNFSSSPNPFERILRLEHKMRHIRGVTFTTWLKDKGTASPKDSVDMHIPVEVRDLAAKLLRNWIAEEGSFDQISQGRHSYNGNRG